MASLPEWYGAAGRRRKARGGRRDQAQGATPAS